MLVGLETVPDLAVNTEMVERVDVGAGMGVHGKCRSRVATGGIHFLADAHRVIHLRAARRMGHPELVMRIARSLPAWHADIVVRRQIVCLAALDARQDGGARFRRDQVEAADFIVRAPRADANFLTAGGNGRFCVAFGMGHLCFGRKAGAAEQ